MTRKSSDQQTGNTPRRPGSLPGDGTIRREDITPAFIDRLEKQVASLPNYSLISHEEREASRQAFLADRRKNQSLWVFGYGSLMWNPAIHVAQTARSTLFGYHRAFCLHLVIGRGSPKKPGLMLGLDAGGSCVGLAHRIAPEHVDSETEILWLREMVGTGYVPKAVRLRIGSRQIEGLTFVANRQSKRYAGRIAFNKAVRRMASAEGDIGTNRDYLYRTIAHLNEFGLAEGPLHALERAVRERAGDL